jgi:hypothetical protein
MTFFERLLLAHVIGDYVFQNTWMASRKGAHYFPCLVHCLIYTLTICLFTSFNPWWALIVFASHFPIDKWSLADKWLRLTRSRSLKTFLEHGHEGVEMEKREVTVDVSAGTVCVEGGTPLSIEGGTSFLGYVERPTLLGENYRILRGGFTSFVYVVVDNTFHIILMLLGGHYLGLWK